MTATYGPSQARTYPYALRNSVPHHSAPAVGSAYPYATSKPRPTEGHTTPSKHAFSPQVSRLRPRASSSVTGSRIDVGSSGLSAGGSKQPSYSTTYKAGVSSRDSSSSRQRSKSHSYPQSQPRSQSPHQPEKMSWYPYMYPSTSRHHESSSSGRRRRSETPPFIPPPPEFSPPPVIPSFPYESDLAAMFGPGHLDTDGVYFTQDRVIPCVPGNQESRARYDPGRAADYTSFGRDGPTLPPVWPPYGGSMPNDGWRGPSASSYSMQPPPMSGFPHRPPSPASHYLFANYPRPGSSSNGAYAERSGHRSRGNRSSNTHDTSPPPPYSTVGPSHAVAVPSQADSTTSDPLIHPALGWWPDQRNPALYWDLSSSSRPRYTKRGLDAAELAASPFTPPLSRMRLVLDPQKRWKFDITAPTGQRYISLAGLFKAIRTLLHTPGNVPHAFWVRASMSKEAILRAMLRRTGRALPVPPPHRRPKPRGQIMEEAVVEGAPNGSTNLLVIDLLCEKVMFAGIEFHKEPDEWVLRTTTRY